MTSIADSDPDREFYCVRTVYSRKIVLMCVKWNLFRNLVVLRDSLSALLWRYLLPGQCGDDEEGTHRLVAASSESYACNSTPQEQPREVRRSVATRKCVALGTV